jgi:hypothetical protein
MELIAFGWWLIMAAEPIAMGGGDHLAPHIEHFSLSG